MTFLHPHVSLTWGGSFFTDETWSCGLRLDCPSFWALTPAAIQAECLNVVDDYATAIEATHVAASTGVSGAAHLDYVKLNWVDNMGRQDPGLDTVRSDAPAGAAGAVGPFPAQICTVVTLDTAVSRGHAHSGRIFVPTGALGFVSGKSAFNDTVAGEMGVAWGGLISTLNAISWGGLGIGVTAKASIMSKLGTGATHQITRLRIGHRYDVQRRRAKNLAEDYTLHIL